MRYDVLSPDGISIEGISYPSVLAAMRALSGWVKRYQWQGFYSTMRWEHISLEDLPGECRIVEAPTDE